MQDVHQGTPGWGCAVIVHTKEGYFVVTERIDREAGFVRQNQALQVWSHEASDLHRLRQVLDTVAVRANEYSDILPTSLIHDLPHSVTCSRNAWSRYMRAVADRIDYHSFPDEVHDQLGADRASRVQDVHVAMTRYKPSTTIDEDFRVDVILDARRMFNPADWPTEATFDPDTWDPSDYKSWGLDT